MNDKYDMSLKQLIIEGISHPDYYIDGYKSLKRAKYGQVSTKSLLCCIKKFFHLGYDKDTIYNTCLLVFDSNELRTYKHLFI